MSYYPKRRARLVEWASGNDLDIFLVTAAVNLRYLTGFTGEGMGAISGDRMAVVTDRRYEVEAGQERPDCEVVFAEEGYLQEVAGYISCLGRCRAGFSVPSGSFCSPSDAIALLSNNKGSSSTWYIKTEPNTIFTIIKEARKIRVNNFIFFPLFLL